MTTPPIPPRAPSSRNSANPLADLPTEDAIRLFRPSPRYQPFLEDAHGSIHRIALLYHACYLEAFSQPAPLGPIPDFLVRHIAELLEVEAPSPLPYPETPRTFFAHAERVRRALGWSDCDARAWRSMERWLAEEARRSDDPDWLRDRLEERLRAAKIVFPGPSRLARLVGRARTKAQEWIARAIGQALTGEQVQAIDGLRRPKSGTRASHLQWLKDPIGIPSPRALDDVLDRIEFIRAVRLPNDLLERIHPDMRRRMTRTVDVYTADSLWQDFPDERRRALIAAYLHERHRALVDVAVEIFDGIALAMERRSEADLAADQKARGPIINDKLLMLKTMLEIMVDFGIPDPSVRPVTMEKLPLDRMLAALRELAELIRPADYNIFDYLERRYSYLRSFFPRFIKVIEFEGVPSAAPLLQAISTLRYWNAEGVRKPPANPPKEFVPKKWLPYVVPGDGRIDRHYYELCAMSELHRTLQAAEVWAVGGRRYGNVEDLLISPETWKEIRDECYQELGLPKDARTWLGDVLPTLETQIRRTVGRLPENHELIVEEDRVRLSPIQAELPSDRLALVKDRVKDAWSSVRIQDVLRDVNEWVGLADSFRTLRGYHKTGAEFERGLFAALIAKGCNIGTTRMATLTPEVAERSLRRIDEIYLYEDTLRSAYARLLAAQRALPIAEWLGDESVSMSDGMRLASHVGTIKAALLPHAFAPGERAITYYWHVSHQGPAYAGQVIGHDRDAAYVLDQIFHIQSELPIREHYTDTHGTTEITFGLAYLFGLEFAPRIKLVHLQDLYHPPGFAVEGPFKKHFEAPVNVELVETWWDDIVRVLASIRRGHTSAVLLSLRLSSYARQNPLYRALREVGRIFKTRFIMRYYDEADFRRRINAGLNRMEFFNALARHLFYARRGENWEREFEQQLNRASALLILANACILWNTVHLTETAQQFKGIGVRFEPEDFRHVSPYAFEHIVPYGEYRFDARRKDRREAYAKARTL